MADLRGAPGSRLPLRPKHFSILYSFTEILAKSYVGCPLPRGLAQPPTEILDPPLVNVADQTYIAFIEYMRLKCDQFFTLSSEICEIAEMSL